VSAGPGQAPRRGAKGSSSIQRAFQRLGVKLVLIWGILVITFLSSGRAVLFSGWIAMLMVYKVDLQESS